jgi:CO/xanthine dehydrogenase Mo-binding subunit
MAHAPQFDVEIVDGRIATPCATAAVANAVSRLTGCRLRPPTSSRLAEAGHPTTPQEHPPAFPPKGTNA